MKTRKIVFAADFAPIRHFSQLLKADPAAVYGDMRNILLQADYAIVNLESPLHCPDGFIVKSGAAFSGELEHISSLAAGNFRAAVLANNHTFDCGKAGFDRTCEVLRNNGIAYVGAGENLASARKPLTFGLDGIKVALFAISEGEDMMGASENSPGVRPWEVEKLADDIRQARKDFDIILVSAHCGLEYQPYPSFYVYEAFELWAQAGADMIIGHHPHVPQGMTVFGRTPAYFSLGNFIFYQPVRLLHRKTGYLLELEIGKSGIVSHRPIPYRITDQGVRSLNEAESAGFADLFARLSAPLGDREQARRAWHAVLAYNGIDGFKDELSRILKTMQDDPVKGAAMLRNRVCCIQHSSQWTDGMSRIMDGSINDAPPEMVGMVREFMTREVEEL